MPAVTADTLTLPRLPEATPTETERPVKRVTTAPSGFEGEGFPVRRAFAGVPTDELDPFIHMDQMGSVDYGPGESRGTNWHPHRGFETVTYMLDGTFQHQDSHGGGGVITDGATQWMTAGGGILHIETPPESLVVVVRHHASSRTGGGATFFHPYLDAAHSRSIHMNRNRRPKASVRLIKRWPKSPSPLAARLRLAGMAPPQGLAQRLGR